LFFDNGLPSDFKKIIVINIYRPPRNNVDDIAGFSNDLEKVFSCFDKEKNIILAGDFNIDLLNIHANQHINEYFENFISSGYVPCLTLPTRLTSYSGTLIDNIFLKMSGNFHLFSGSLISDISDHLLCFTTLKCKIFNGNDKFIKISTSPNDVLTNIKSDLNKTDICEKLNSLTSIDVNMHYTEFNNILQNLIATHTQTKVVKFNKHRHKKSKWITNGILKSISYRDKLYAKYKKTPSTSAYHDELKTHLNLYNRMLRKCIRQTKKIYYETLFTKYKNDIKKTWGCVNSILNKSQNTTEYPSSFLINNEYVDNFSEIVNEFNKYFTEIGSKLANNIETPRNGSFKDYLISKQTVSFEFKPVSPEDIIKIIDELKPKTSSGLDKISNRFLKYVKKELSSTLSKLINISLAQCTFPDQLKIAKITPIFKSKNQYLLENYRPISILPGISKIFEKVMYNQITDHFNDNNLFYLSQYGFRKGHNTEYATVELINRITSEMDENKSPLNIYLDMSKAFDTIDHVILLEKLEHYGMKNKSLKLLRSYMTNRLQYVELNNAKSTLLPIQTGVPQGSILGPLLFIIYINDLSNASDLFYPIIYADDTTLFTTLQASHSLDTQKDTSENINKELSKVDTWLKLNKMSLNCNKTKAMIFHKPQKHIQYPKIKIQDQEIEYVKQFNFLGITLDCHLRWKPHALNVSKKLSKTIGIMNKLKHVLPTEVMILIYNSLFLSYLNYGLFLWGWQCQNIGKLVKRAVRIISKAKYNAHTGLLFKNNCLLNFESLCKLHDYKLCYKLSNGMLPEYLSALNPSLQIMKSRYATRQTNQSKLKLPFVKHDFAKQSFKFRIPDILNHMHTSIKDKIYTHSLIGFKLYVKKFLIDSYNINCTIPNCYVCC